MIKANFPVTIFHNPNCGTSRNVLAALVQAGLDPQVVRYLDEGWTVEQLKSLAADAGVPVRDFLRVKGAPASELGLLEEGVSEEALLAAMVAHPILVERPIVRTPRGVALCRPSETVFDLLEERPDAFTKEDGEVVKL